MTPIKENVLQTGECQLGAEQYYKCPDGTPVVRCKCTSEGKWNCISSPENSCPVRKTVTEIRYYKCPDGTQVKWCECFEGGCACLMSPENSCPLTNQPPVTPGEVCQTLKETKYYQCPDGQTIPWCMCAPEGNFTGALNKWQCQRFPELSCPKPVVAPTPTPTEPMIACCIEGGVCVYETKEHCLLKKGTPASSCSPNPCPQPIIEPTPKPVCIQVITPAMGPDGTCKEFSTPCDVPTGWKQVDKCPAVVQPTPQPTTTVSTECKAGETKKYTCSDGTLVEHCKCTSEGKWDCLTSPEKSCPVSTTTPVPSTTTEKILTVISPNGGETWYMGKTYDILWKSSGVEKVNIEVNVSKDGVPVGTLSIAGSDLITLASAGKYSWTPNSQHLKEGNQFKIVIRNAEMPYTPEDQSDAYFSIIDTTPPVISSIAVYNITSTSAKIEWETDESATSRVVYGTTDIYHTGSEIETPLDSSLLIHHSLSLSNLEANTLYHYRVESKDAAGNLTVSGSASFTTATETTTTP